MVMKKASGGDSPLRQGAGKSFWTLPILRRRRRPLDQALRVFSSRRIYRRKGDVRRWTRGPHHAPEWPGGVPRHAGCGRPLASLRLCFGLRLVSGKIGTSAFVLSKTENISCVTFLKHKNSRKQETSTVASL
jgi:hypothetical protein